MSAITFSENHESALVSFEEGLALSSLREPREQGLKWAYSLGAIPSNHVIVVGLGSGFHVAALADVDPDVQITVVETRDALLPVFRAQFDDLQDRVEVVFIENAEDVFKNETLQEAMGERAYVLSFQECWGQQRALFSEVFSHLTGRSIESVKYHFEEFGVNIKALHLQSQQLASIKDILPSVESSALQENKKQIFKVLGELVK